MVSERTGTTPLQTLLDRAEIFEIVNRLNNALGGREWTSVRALLAEEVETDRAHPDGGGPTFVEADVLVDEWRATLGGFDATQHALTNHAVSVAGDEATCSVHVQARHYLPNYMGSGC